jgi:hypothetical protein
MKKLIWPAGLLLAFALLFPNGITVKVPSGPVLPVTPVTPVVPPAPPEPAVATDAKIVELLANASPADKGRVRGVYSAMVTVLQRDSKTGLLKTTEQVALWQENTLKNAIDDTMRGKYPGLDVAIEAVFDRKLRELDPEGKRDPKDVQSVDDAVRGKLIEACTLIANSAR